MSSWNFNPFMVVTHKWQLSPVSKSTIGWARLSFLVWLKLNFWYQNGFSVYDPANAEFVIIVMANRRNGALLKTFSPKDWFCLAGKINVFAKISDYLYSTGVYSSMSILFSDNQPWKQYGECKANNQQFQDKRWGCHNSSKNCVRLWLDVAQVSNWVIETHKSKNKQHPVYHITWSRRVY